MADDANELMERALIAFADTFSDEFFKGTSVRRVALEIAEKRGLSHVLAKIEGNRPAPYQGTLDEQREAFNRDYPQFAGSQFADLRDAVIGGRVPRP